MTGKKKSVWPSLPDYIGYNHKPPVPSHPKSACKITSPTEIYRLVFASLTTWPGFYVKINKSQDHATVKRKQTFMWRDTTWTKSLTKKSVCRSIGGFVISDSVLAKLATIWIKTRANSWTGHCESVFILKSLYILRYGMFISYLLICAHFFQQHQTINCHWSIYELSMIILPLPDSSLEQTFKRCELQTKKMWKRGFIVLFYSFFFVLSMQPWKDKLLHAES